MDAPNTSPDPAELAERRAAQSAREAHEAREAADRALRSARWCALLAMGSVVLALAATWRAAAGDLSCDSLTIGSPQGHRIVMKTDADGAYVWLYHRGSGQPGVTLAVDQDAGSVVAAMNQGGTRYAQLSVDNTNDFRDLARLLLVHDDRRQAVTAVFAPKWEGRD